jgi:hypothetical protein
MAKRIYETGSSDFGGQKASRRPKSARGMWERMSDCGEDEPISVRGSDFGIFSVFFGFIR